jgi:hypothetical protein
MHIAGWAAKFFGLTLIDQNSWIDDGDLVRDGLRMNGRGKRRLGQLYARVRGSAGSKK